MSLNKNPGITEKVADSVKAISEKVPFFKSLRFKLTLFYSLIVFLFSSIFVLGINFSLNEYFEKEPQRPGIGIMQHYNAIIDTEERRELLRQLRLADLHEIQNRSVKALVPLGLMSFVVGYIISGIFLKPLQTLRDEMDKFDDTGLGNTIEVDTDDEIGAISSSFNRMSARLKDSFDRQSQFVQDASHELRTPLAVVKTNLEVLLDGDSIKNEDDKEFVTASIDSINRLEKLTCSLMELTRNEDFHFEEVDLTKVVSSQIAILQQFAKSKKVKIDNQVKGINIIKADETLLGRAIFNVLENSLKYGLSSKGKSIVRLSCEKVHDWYELVIEDSGSGIPVAMRDRIFDRFYRIDKSRSRKEGGFGLGLAITKQIIALHRGAIFVEDSELGGAKFTIRLS